MVDNELRKKLSEFIERYAREEIDASYFSDGLTEISCNNRIKDKVIKLWRDAYFHLYEVYCDKKIVIDKQGWDFLQRSILFFQTDLPLAGFITVTNYKCDYTQLIAGATIVTQVALLTCAFIFESVMLLFLPFVLGVVVFWLITKRRKKIAEELGVDISQELEKLFNQNLYPFVHRSDIYKAIKATKFRKAFKKTPYPDHISEPFNLPPRHTDENGRVSMLFSYMLAAGLSPIILLFYAILPISYKTIKTEGGMN